MDRDEVIRAFTMVGMVLGEIAAKELDLRTQNAVATAPASKSRRVERTRPRRAIADEDSNLKETRYVCEFAQVADLRALNGHMEAGYFPKPVQTNPHKWDNVDLIEWLEWKESSESRKTFRIWRNSGEAGFDG